MDLLAFNILVQIIEHGNLSQAAKFLNMSRANVSYHLARLEKSLGASLLRRTPQGVEATEVGRRIYRHARNILNETELVRDLAHSSTDEISGKIGLSVPTGYGHLVMAPWLIEFKRAHPQVVLDIRLENFIDNLLKDSVDIAIRVMSEPPPMLVARDMGPVLYSLCASRQWLGRHRMPETPSELWRTPLITSGGESGRARLQISRNGQPLEELDIAPTLMSRNYPFLCDCIASGLGLGLVPDYMVRRQVEEGHMALGMQDHEFRINQGRMFMLYMPNRFQSAATRALIDFLSDRMGLARMIRPGDAESARQP
jgi:DNA-binding transcriptional LysR family regulator